MKLIALTFENNIKKFELPLVVGRVRIVDDKNTVLREFLIDEFGKVTTSLGADYKSDIAKTIASKFNNLDADKSVIDNYNEIDKTDTIVYENDFSDAKDEKNISMVINFGINECKHSVIQTNEKLINSELDNEIRDLEEKLTKVTKQKSEFSREFKDNWKSFSTSHRYVYAKQFSKDSGDRYFVDLDKDAKDNKDKFWFRVIVSDEVKANKIKELLDKLEIEDKTEQHNKLLDSWTRYHREPHYLS